MAEPTLPDPATQVEAATALWEGLASLLRPTAETGSLPCVRLSTGGGDGLDIYRAERIPRAMMVWKVRGLARATGDTASEQRAVLMGTQDGRAMLVFPADSEAGGPRPSEIVVGAQLVERDLADLAEIIAAAVRRLIGSPP